MASNIYAHIFSSFPALKHRNFRLFWFGQCISLIGTWMQNIGQSWLVLQLTNSALKLSIVNMVQFLPMMVFSLFAGSIIDRFPKRKIIIFTQVGFGILALILASITYFDIVKYWHILVLALLLGIINTLDLPARQAFFVDLVGKEDLMNAITLNSSIFNLARIIGPAVAGFLIGILGIAICFYINALSFIPVIAGIWMIKIPAQNFPKKPADTQRHMLSDIFEGIRYIGGKEIIKMPLLLLAIISTFVMNFNVLIPVYAQQDLGRNATGYGFLMTCMGLGSFIGALSLAAMSKAGPRLDYLLGGAFGMSLFMALLGMGKNYILASILLFLIGLFTIVFTASVNSIVQLNSEDHMLGRVMSVYSLAFGGMTPIGSLYTGGLTEYTGTPGCMIISGMIGIAAAASTIFILRKSLLHNRS